MAPEELDQGAGAGAPSPVGADGGGAPESQGIDFPADWRAEDRQHWDSAPEDIRKIISAREKNWQAKSAEFKSAHENWSRFDPVIRRFQPLFQKEGVTPDQGIGNLLQLTHDLTYGDDSQKQKLLETLQSIYGPKKPAKQFLDPDVGEIHGELTQRLVQQEQAINGLNQLVRGFVEDSTRRDIDAFSKNPEHKHFDKLAGVMGKMISSGVLEQMGLPNDMPSAYQAALQLHPKLVEKAEAEKRENQSDIKRAQSKQALQAAGVNVRGSGRAPEGTKRPESGRKFLEKTYDKIVARS